MEDENDNSEQVLVEVDFFWMERMKLFGNNTISFQLR